MGKISRLLFSDENAEKDTEGPEARGRTGRIKIEEALHAPHRAAFIQRLVAQAKTEDEVLFDLLLESRPLGDFVRAFNPSLYHSLRNKK